MLKHANLDVPSAHILEIRRKILNSAKSLLVKNGYKKTTIRKIADDSGVLIGSIYYIFKNKEDICQSMILAVGHSCIHKIEQHCPDESPAFRYAAVCALELKEMEAAPVIRDVYRAGYDSDSIFEGMVNQFARLAYHVFKGSPYEADEETYYQDALLIKGGMRACIAEMNFSQPHEPDRSRLSLLRMALTLFGVPEKEREETVARVIDKDALWLKIANELATQPIEDEE